MNIVVLTGAGISAESGLAAFRGGGGLWAGRRVEEVCTPDALARNPDLVCDFYDDRRAAAAQAQPNPAHEALGKLERYWREQAKGAFLLVTQNVDDLHERAGSTQVIHMHGELKAAYCMECGWHGPRYLPLEGDRECADCGREALRPDIVLFGEAPRHMRQIEEALRSCDLFLAIGTSGTVYPAAGFVEIAKDNGAQTHQFNTELPVGSHHFDMCHVGRAGEMVPKWIDGLLGEKPAGWGLKAEQKAALIKKMEDWGAHSTWYCAPMAEKLREIGLDAEALPDGSLRLYEKIIKPVQPEWGEPGIYGPSILSAAIEAHGLEITTEMLGRGFGHRDRLEQLKTSWDYRKYDK